MSRLPSLSALHVFMVAAQHPNLSSAARALFITQSAVSKQIKNLEEQLGSVLFHRSANRLELTDTGMTLSASLNQAFELITEGVNQIKNKNKTDIELTILTPPTIATRWLSSHLHHFYAKHGNISLSIVTSPVQSPADIEIRFASAQPQAKAQLLALEQNILVCADMLFKDDLATLLKCYPILHILHGEQILPLWSQWLKHYYPHIEIKREFKFSTQDQVIQAALHGLGIAIVDRTLVLDLLKKGFLRQIHPKTQHGPYGYWLIEHSKNNTKEAVLFCSWLLEYYQLSLQKSENT